MLLLHLHPIPTHACPWGGKSKDGPPGFHAICYKALLALQYSGLNKGPQTT